VEGENTHSYILKGLDAKGRYLLRFYDHTSSDRAVTGQELMTQGLKVTLALPNSSELIFIERAAR